MNWFDVDPDRSRGTGLGDRGGRYLCRRRGAAVSRPNSVGNASPARPHLGGRRWSKSRVGSGRQRGVHHVPRPHTWRYSRRCSATRRFISCHSRSAAAPPRGCYQKYQTQRPMAPHKTVPKTTPHAKPRAARSPSSSSSVVGSGGGTILPCLTRSASFKQRLVSRGYATVAQTRQPVGSRDTQRDS